MGQRVLHSGLPSHTSFSYIVDLRMTGDHHASRWTMDDGTHRRTTVRSSLCILWPSKFTTFSCGLGWPRFLTSLSGSAPIAPPRFRSLARLCGARSWWVRFIVVVGFHVLPSPAGPKQTSTSRTVADHIAVYHVAQVVVGRSPTGIPGADTTDEPGRKPQTEGS